MTTREPTWRRYLRFLGPDVAADVEDELADHLARLDADFRAQGMNEAEIRHAVREHFGDVDVIRARLRRQDTRRLRRSLRAEAVSDLIQDIRVALRSLRKSPTTS